MNVHFSSKKMDWATPWPLFHTCESAYGPFTLDVCATAKNTKCQRFFSPDVNGLLQPWRGTCWMKGSYDFWGCTGWPECKETIAG